MTLDTSIILPSSPERLGSSEPGQANEYMRELTFTLERMYSDLAEGINGNIRGSQLPSNTNWTPTIKDTADTAITFTYSHQSGWVYRQGLMTEVWFDVSWSAASSALSGNLYVDLPYKVATTAQMPFVGIIQPSDITFTSGTEVVINAVGDTYRGEIWNTGNGITTSNQQTTTSGRLIGHVRYLGKRNE